MRIATFLPHVGVFGGVRRYIELGNAWVDAGHEVTLYHPDGSPPGWLPCRARVRPLADAAAEASDVAWCSDAHTWGAFRDHRAGRHVCYVVLERDPLLAAALADDAVLLAANSTPLRRRLEQLARRPVIDGAGGIDVARFHPPAPRPAARATPLRVLVNGRRSRPKKGTDLVLAALRGLDGRVPEFETVLVDTPGPRDPDPRIGARTPPRTRWVLGATQDELAALYRDADVFVAAERKAGWCNGALEAMASGCAVACTTSGTTDFARDRETALVVPFRHPWFVRRAVARLLRDPALRARLGAAGPAEAARWRWELLAARLLDGIAAARTAAEVRAAGA